jgi:hypothetical protein
MISGQFLVERTLVSCTRSRAVEDNIENLSRILFIVCGIRMLMLLLLLLLLLPRRLGPYPRRPSLSLNSSSISAACTHNGSIVSTPDTLSGSRSSFSSPRAGLPASHPSFCIPKGAALQDRIHPRETALASRPSAPILTSDMGVCSV